MELMQTFSNLTRQIYQTPLVILTTSPLPSATTGSQYGDQIFASGGNPYPDGSYRWSVVSAAPNTGNWVTINAVTGQMYGVPTTAETETIVVQVTDLAGHTAQQTFSLVVNAGSGVVFNYFIAPAAAGGSMSNTGTSPSSPWTLAAIWQKSTIYAGQNVGLIAGSYGPDCAAAVSNWVTYINNGGGPGNINPAQAPFLPVQGSSSSASPTYIASCNSSGTYQARGAVLDFHPTVGSLGVAAYVTNVSILNTTQISITYNSPSSNSSGTLTQPFAIGNVLSFYQIAGMTGLNGQTGTVAAVGGSAGAWTATVTLSVNPNTLGTWTSGSNQFVYYNYPNIPNGFYYAGGIGWASNQQTTGGPRVAGNITLDGLVVTGVWGNAMLFFGSGGQHSYSMSGITVQNCDIYDCSGPENQNTGGPYFENLGGTMNTVAPFTGSTPNYTNNGTGFFFCNNLIHDIGYGLRSANGNFDIAGLWVWQSQNHTVRYNTIYDCGVCTFFKSGSQGSWQFQNNFLECDPLYPYTCFDDGQLSDNSLSVQLTWNFSYNILMPHGAQNSSFLGVMADTGSNDIYQGTLVNNTFYSYESGCSGFYSVNGAPNGYSGTYTGTIQQYNNIYDLARNGALNYLKDFSACALSQSGTSPFAYTTLAVTLSDYCLYDGTSSTTVFAISPYSSAGNPFTNGTMTLAQWRTATALDTHSGNGSPTYTSAPSGTGTGHTNPSGFILANGSLGKVGGSLPGSSNGTSGGSATDMGAYGNGNTQVGCNFTSTVLDRN